MMEKIRCGESVVKADTIRLRQDGKKIHVAVALSPIKDSNGPDLTGPFCTSRREREFTRRTAGHAKQEVQSRTDRDVAASD
jgi:hypothetical protein